MSLRELTHYNRRGSYCQLSDHDFAELVAASIAEALSAYRGATLDVGGYTPPYNEGYFPAGFIALSFLAEGLDEHVVGIEFGQRDESGDLLREGFNPAASLRDQHNPHSAGIYAVNFDEAWRIVCLVARRLRVSRVTLSYGC